MRLASPRYWLSRWDESARKRAEEERHNGEMKAFYGTFVGPGDICFDVGANLGNRTAILSEIGCRVVSIEPQPLCLKRLRKLFGKQKNVVIVDAAAGEREGQGELAICEDEPTISTMSDKWRTEGRFAGSNQWPRKITVRMTTLDALIAQHGMPKFCLLKMDCEGAEYGIFYGSSPDDLARISQIAMEVHSGPKEDENIDALETFLCNNGFKTRRRPVGMLWAWREGR